jgi:RNA polymerase sigma factor (sigma-70 family)
VNREAGDPTPEFQRPGEEQAFALTMELYSRLVFSTARRRLGGDAESAREVAQNVFLTAFRKAGTLAKVKFPAAWFHRAAILESFNFLRAERRRRKNLEAWAAGQSAVPVEADGSSESLRVHLDEALNELRETDRELVLGRFFEGRSFQELANRRGCTPDAVRMKLSRILEKLSTVLKRRGVAITVAGLVSACGSQWSHAAPAGLGAAVTAAASTSAATSQVPLLFAAMTSGKALTLTILAVLLSLFGLQSQSARIDDLKAKLEQRVAAALASSRSNAGQPNSLYGNKRDLAAGSPSDAKPVLDSGAITGATLMDAVRKPNGKREEWYGTYITTKLDDRLEKMTAEELVALLGEINAAQGGARVKSQARSLIIARFLAEKDPAAAIQQAIRLRMTDDVFHQIARRWCAQENGDGVKSLFRLLENPDALPARKFGSDPAGALRQEIAMGMALRDLPAAIALCRDAAGTPAAGDYLLGLKWYLVNERNPDTIFELLGGVPDSLTRTRILQTMAVEANAPRGDTILREFVGHPQFPQDMRKEIVLRAALESDSLHGAKALELIENGSRAEDRLETTVAWLRAAEPPNGIGRMSPVEVEVFHDTLVENALRLAAARDPAAAQRWLPGILDPDRRARVARELKLTLP